MAPARKPHLLAQCDRLASAHHRNHLALHQAQPSPFPFGLHVHHERGPSHTALHHHTQVARSAFGDLAHQALGLQPHNHAAQRKPRQHKSQHRDGGQKQKHAVDHGVAAVERRQQQHAAEREQHA
ncbi:hypothetical protein D3C72_1459190 [compost metagenome]